MSRLKQSKRSKPLRQRPTANNKKAQSFHPLWQPHLSQYEEQRILTFSSEKELEAAIDLLWRAELRHLPHETPDGTSLVIPGQAVDYFRRAGLRFTDKKVRRVADLQEEEIRRLRR
jgi:hypothetical protein